MNNETYFVVVYIYIHIFLIYNKWNLINAVKKKGIHCKLMISNALTNIKELNLIVKCYFNHTFGAERVLLLFIYVNFWKFKN